MLLSTGDIQRFIGYRLWPWGLPKDLANAHNEMLAARGKAVINYKINNSNFGPLHETKDLHASPAPIGRIKKQKEHKKHKTPHCACTFSEIAGAFSSYSAFSAFLFWRGTRQAMLSRRFQLSAARQTGGGKKLKLIIFAKATDHIGLTPTFAHIDDHLRVSR